MASHNGSLYIAGEHGLAEISNGAEIYSLPQLLISAVAHVSGYLFGRLLETAAKTGLEDMIREEVTGPADFAASLERGR